MSIQPESVLGSLSMGLAVALLVYACRDWMAAGFDAVERDLAGKLRRLRASTRHLRKYLLAWLAAMAVSFAGFWFLLDNLTFALLASVFLIAAPWYLLHRMAERRRQKIEDQLADAMVALSSAIRAGMSLAQSLEILAAQCPNPIKAEFHQIVAEYNLGKPLEQTLMEAKQRLNSENFALFAAAMLASYQSGGRLNETVERIAQSVLELQRLERKVISETAQARKSAVYMAVTPAFVLVAYWFLDPLNTKPLFTTTLGHFILGTVVVLDVLAYLWARRILNPDI